MQLCRPDEDVAEAPHGLDERRLGGIRFDQLAQARNLHVDRAVERTEFAAACELHQLVAGKRRARVLHEHLEQREFAGSERQRFAVFRQAARAEIERELAEVHDLLLARRRTGRLGGGGPAQHGLYARDKLARIEWLRQIVVGADFEADDAVDVVAFGRQHDDRHFVAEPAQAPADRQAVFAGHHEIEHHQVEALAREPAVHVVAIGDRAHAVALLGEIAVQQFPQAGVVIDDDDAGLGIGHKSPLVGGHASGLAPPIPARKSSIGGGNAQLTQIVTKKPWPLTACLQQGSSMASIECSTAREYR